MKTIKKLKKSLAKAWDMSPIDILMSDEFQSDTIAWIGCKAVEDSFNVKIEGFENAVTIRDLYNLLREAFRVESAPYLKAKGLVVRSPERG